MDGLNAIAERHALSRLRDGDEWMLAEDIPQCDFFFASIWLRAFVNNLEDSCGRNYSKILAVFRKGDMKFHYGENDCLEFARKLVGKIAENPGFGKAINDNIRRHSDLLEDDARKIPDDLSKASAAEIYTMLERHCEIHTRLYEWGWLPNATDMFHPEFTGLLKALLLEKAGGNEAKASEWFVALTAPEEKSEEALQHDEFLRLAQRLEAMGSRKAFAAEAGSEEIMDSLDAAAISQIKGFAVKYAAISALWIGEPFPAAHYAEELRGFFNSGKDAATELERSETELRERRALKERLERELNLDAKTCALFGVFAEFMVTKFYRRYRQLRALHALRRVFGEVSRRFGVTPLQARCLMIGEYEKLFEGRLDAGVLRERSNFCVLYAEKGNALVFTGEEAKLLEKSAHREVDASVTELKGQCASLGRAVGRVRIVNNPRDMARFVKGEVLVAIATNPDVVPAMKRACAIVTEQGGVTCHAAIVSRELDIPCIIGTRVATRVLRDGELVEVDATLGVVRRLE